MDVVPFAMLPCNSRRFTAQEIALIRAPRDHAALANMTDGYALRLGSASVKTSEHLYQASKLPHSGRVSVLTAAKGRNAKTAAYGARELWHPDWFDIRVTVMRWCLAVKLDQHWAQIAPLLLSTDALPIVEWSRKDSFWGALSQADGTLVGFNCLGTLWEELRELARVADRRLVSECAVPPSCLDGEWAWPGTA